MQAGMQEKLQKFHQWKPYDMNKWKIFLTIEYCKIVKRFKPIY
jgi:hypothetical protein